jgi:KaiC/GvpD/RAD55 family RecA-like ATPase
VKTLINKEAKLKLTSSLLDEFASTVYNVITRNPSNYEHETAIREYVDALIHSQCLHVRSGNAFVKRHLDRAQSALDGCRNSLQSDEITPARGLLVQFLEQICLVSLAQFEYLPFKDFRQNVDLISNLLKEEAVKQELKTEFRLSEDDLSKLQRIKFMMQKKDTASRKALEKMVGQGEDLTDLFMRILQERSIHTELEQARARPSETIPPSHLSTGYHDLDDLLLGGIPDKYAVVLASPSCDERDMLIAKFLETGASLDQTTFYITIDAQGTESLVEHHKPNFYLFICNPEADEIVPSSPNVFKLRGVENLNDLNIALNSALQSLNITVKAARRACIEIVSDVLLQHHALTTRRWLSALIPRLKSRGFTTLAVINPHMHSSQEVQAILDLFEGEIDIYKKQTEKGVRKFIRIEKMLNSEYLEDETRLKKERIQKS